MAMRGVLRFVGGLVVLAILGVTGPANASLIGTELTVNRTFNGLVRETATITVPNDGSVAVDFALTDISFPDGETISMTFPGVGDVNFGVEFLGLDWGAVAGELVGVELFEIAGDFNVTITSNTTSDSLLISFLGDNIASGSILEAHLDVTHSVPEPSTLALFVIALGGLGLMARRRVA